MEDLAQPPLADPEIPNKLYFRIGEVAKLAGIKPYVLRFWESEFSGLGPKKSGTGHRSTGAKTSSWCSKSNACFTKNATPLKALVKCSIPGQA